MNTPNDGSAEEKRKRTGSSLAHSIAESRRHPVIQMIAFIAGTIVATCGVLKMGIVPRVLYMPPKDIDAIEGSKLPVELPSPRNEERITLGRMPEPETTPDSAAIATISPRGMEAVRFALRYIAAKDEEKKRMAEEVKGKKVDWDMVVALNLGMKLGPAIVVCRPLYFRRWSYDFGDCNVTANADSENIALALDSDQIVRVQGDLEITALGVEIKNATIKVLPDKYRD